MAPTTDAVARSLARLVNVAPRLRAQLLAWYDAHRRALPWRRAPEPYAVWVAETMLQQTRVATVLPYWQRWMDRWPTVAALAAADPDEVRALWAGLGYYRRARALHACARAIEAAVRHGATLARIPAIEARELAEGVARGDLAAVDVRGETEWAAGHVPGAVHIPLGYLVDRRAEVPRDRPVAVYCQSGGRSAIAASLLRALGFERVVDVRGGFAAWRAQGYPVARPGGDAALTIGG